VRVGILGGGQLGRMIALSSYPLGIAVRLFESSDNACGGQVTELHVGEYDDQSALARFADGLDVVTYEFENVPVESARFLEQRLPVFPPPQSLEVAQDRLIEKRFFRNLGIPTADFADVSTLNDLTSAATQFGFPLVLKTRRMGYDGKGQVVIYDVSELGAAWDELSGVPLIAEAFVPFDRELSIISVRSKDGSTRFYPLVQNHHHQGILRISRAPAPAVTSSLQDIAQEFAGRALEALDYVGVLAIEFFHANRGLLANEMAPRVHNSGHWTIEGAETSQFENHLRAVADLPLGSTRPRGASIMVNIIGDVPSSKTVLCVDNAHLHFYGKSPRPGRKLGHVTLHGEDLVQLDRQLTDLEPLLP
jgi:5-(carboxyamino)imidazole ribonucleotide synthase